MINEAMVFPGSMERQDPVLQIENLQTHFYTRSGVVKAVDGVSLRVNPRETFGVVGETGCGKSVMALSVMRLIEWPPGRIVGGRVSFLGNDLLKVSDQEMRQVRGNKISMIFQEPMTSLNPVYTIGDQIAETIRLHQSLSRSDAIKKAVGILRRVRISDPERTIKKHPHELSGGMRQRVMIAIATSCNPKLLIADEPTTALDVTIEAQILELMKELVREIGASVMLITHDLGIVAENCDRLAVMYAGNVVESGSVRAIFSKPGHPYTNGLLKAIPRLGRKRGEPLTVIKGSVPDLTHPPRGCKFHPRCPHAVSQCSERIPQLVEIEPDHVVSCWLHNR